MKRRRLAIVVAALAAGLGVAALALVPLRLVLDRLALPAVLAATDASGTVWNGTLHRVHWDGRPLGDIDVALQPRALLAGVQRVRLEGAAASAVLLDGRRRGIEGAHGTLAIDRVAGLGGLDLRLGLDDATMVFDATGCRAAGGSVRLGLSLPAAPAPLLELAGTPACAGDSVRVRLVPSAGTDAAPDVDALLEVAGDGRWRLHALVRAPDPSTRFALQAAGFQEAPGGLSRAGSGRVGGF